MKHRKENEQQQQQQKTARMARLNQGAAIAVFGRVVKYKDEEAWLVQDEYNSKVYYKVKQDGSCECADSKKDIRITCKHFWTVKAKRLLPRAEAELKNETAQ
jgi:hypothetical protein